MSKGKVVLAYSGGLDTSVILKWLVNKGFEVICFVGNIGQQEDFDYIHGKALKTGASKVFIRDLREEFITDFIYPALMGDAIYEGRYLLGTALARPLLAKEQMKIAKAEGAKYVAHGATGKGNDQVRFELSYYAIDPDIKVISPWKDQEFLSTFAGRSDLLEYAKKYGIEVKATKSKPYSEDENLMHISHEAGLLEDPLFCPDESIFSRTTDLHKAPDTDTVLEIHFKNGLPNKVVNKKTGAVKKEPLEIFAYLNEAGSKNGIGRVDIVENRFIGIKSRGVYETPGATILWTAHRDLEGIAMDKEVMRLKDMLSPKFSELIYNGFWFSPEMDFLISAFSKSQEAIDGKVIVSLYKGNVFVLGREAYTGLYNQKFSSMDEKGGFDASDSRGFININAIRLKAHNRALHVDDPYLWRKHLLKRLRD
ncbi:MAG: argininosuccinate synthase [Candidatus Micrarchaeota archaeon]|nr:argininosuccinate synthase [Candidatus Micrarchaeota archaeon]